MKENSDAPVRVAFDNKKNILSLSGKKSWLVSTNVEMILLFVRLKNPIELSFDDSTRLLNSVLISICKEKSAIRKRFEKTRFLRNLNQGNLTLENTQIFSKHISSGKKIRGFGASEQFFVMLSLGIYFVTKVKSPKLKRRFYITVKALILDFNARKPLKFLVKYHKKPLIKLINTFGQLPERKAIINWDTDKIIFKNMLK